MSIHGNMQHAKVKSTKINPPLQRTRLFNSVFVTLREVFYVQSGDGSSGDTVFQNPAISTYIDRGTQFLNNMSTVRVKPKDGMLVLFPSYLTHYQALYTGTQDRIVIAFNSSVNDIIKEENQVEFSMIREED